MAKCWIYKTQQGDTFDSISLDFYKTETYSSNIMQANPDYISTLVFDAGVKLLVPQIEIPKTTSLPPWKR